MHLLDSELKNKEQWEKAEISLPQFDRQAMKEAKRFHGKNLLMTDKEEPTVGTLWRR